MITRLVQWLATLAVAAAGFVVGVNAAGPSTYRTDAGRVRIGIRLALPGNLVRVDVPQLGYSARLHPFHAPLEWRARTLTLNRRGRALLGSRGAVDRARLVLSGRDAVLRSSARSFAWGAAGALAGALFVALLFAALFGGLASRLLVGLFAIAPLLVAGAVAFLVAASAL